MTERWNLPSREVMEEALELIARMNKHEEVIYLQREVKSLKYEIEFLRKDIQDKYQQIQDLKKQIPTQ